MQRNDNIIECDINQMTKCKAKNKWHENRWSKKEIPLLDQSTAMQSRRREALKGVFWYTICAKHLQDKVFKSWWWHWNTHTHTMNGADANDASHFFIVFFVALTFIFWAHFKLAQPSNTSSFRTHCYCRTNYVHMQQRKRMNERNKDLEPMVS